MTVATFWNGLPCPARKVRVIVGKAPRRTWWCAELAGQERDAVEVDGHSGPFYLDNADGSGWEKVTVGKGSPWWGHSSLPVEKVIWRFEPKGKTK